MIKLGFEIGVAAFVALLTFCFLLYLFDYVVTALRKGSRNDEKRSDKVTQMPKKEN